MGGKRRERVVRDWAVVFGEFSRSGMSVKEFCLSKGITKSLFYRRRQEFRDSNPSVRLVPDRGDFIELRQKPASQWAAAIDFGNQIELSIANDCGSELLRSIISQLKVSSC